VAGRLLCLIELWIDADVDIDGWRSRGRWKNFDRDGRDEVVRSVS
jgi:hypothetical protein